MRGYFCLSVVLRRRNPEYIPHTTSRYGIRNARLPRYDLEARIAALLASLLETDSEGGIWVKADKKRGISDAQLERMPLGFAGESRYRHHESSRMSASVCPKNAVYPLKQQSLCGAQVGKDAGLLYAPRRPCGMQRTK